SNKFGPGYIHFAWKPIQAKSVVELKMLQLLLRSLAQGEQSLLYKSLVDSATRVIDSAATTVDSDVLLDTSPFYPVPIVECSGFPGTRISLEEIELLKDHILSKISDIAQYPDHSQKLATFNRLVQTYADAWRRTETIWTKNAPEFGIRDS